MEENKTNLDELFKLPIGLKEVIKLDGKTLYGSEELNKSYIEALESVSITKGHINIFKKLVLEKKIIPCFLTGGLPSFVFWKIFAPEHLKNVLAFFEPLKTKKVYILLSNNLNLFAYTANDWIAKLTIHECLHMLAKNKPNEFMSLFKDLLIDFYTEYFKIIFNSNDEVITTKRIEEILNFLFWKIEVNDEPTSLSEYQNLLRSIFKGTMKNEKHFEDIVYRLLSIVYVFLTKPEQFYKSKGNFRDVLWPLENCYKSILKISPGTTVIQELLYPSEIIAIAAEHPKYTSKCIDSLKHL